MKFRKCVNEYGYYKIQRWCPPINFLLFKTKGTWKDTCFSHGSTKCKVFKYVQEADRAMNAMIATQKRNNNKWECVDKNI